MKKEALNLFREGYNCAQSILIVYGNEFGLTKQEAIKLASGFVGGLAGLGMTCGLLNASIMILGMKNGSDLNNKEQNQHNKFVIQSFIREFLKKHKQMDCIYLLTKEEEGNPHKMHSSKCELLLIEVCELLEKYLKSSEN